MVDRLRNMEVYGICSICGKAGKLYTCRFCGKNVCNEHFDFATWLCINCKGKII